MLSAGAGQQGLCLEVLRGWSKQDHAVCCLLLQSLAAGKHQHISYCIIQHGGYHTVGSDQISLAALPSHQRTIGTAAAALLCFAKFCALCCNGSAKARITSSNHRLNECSMACSLIWVKLQIFSVLLGDPCKDQSGHALCLPEMWQSSIAPLESCVHHTPDC